MDMLFWCVVSLASVIGAWAVWRPRARARRVAAFAPKLKEFDVLSSRLAVSEAQQRLGGEVAAMREADAFVQDQYARVAEIPEPPSFAPEATPASRAERLARWLDQPLVYVGAAAGEQLLTNAAEALVPGALPVLAEHVAHAMTEAAHHAVTEGLWDTLKEASWGAHSVGDVLHGAVGEVATGAIERGATAVAERGADAVDPSAMQGYHFPWATLVVSCVREGSLLIDGKTDPARAVAHVALDVGGAGAGAFAGAKAGALAGSIVPGAGTAIGAVIGGIAGGVLGRMAAQHVKQQPLRQAQASFEQLRSRAVAEIDSSTDQFVSGVVAAARRAQVEHTQRIQQLPTASKVVRGPLHFRQAVQDVCTAIEWGHRHALEELDTLATSTAASIPPTRWWETVLGVDVTMELMAAVERRRTDRRRLIDGLLRRLPSMQKIADDPLAALDTLADIPCLEQPQFARAIQRLLSQARVCTLELATQAGCWRANAIASRQRAGLDIVEAVRTESARHRAHTKDWDRRLDTAASKVKHEMAALGMA